jgi:hypothetical protein
MAYFLQKLAKINKKQLKNTAFWAKKSKKTFFLK